MMGGILYYYYYLFTIIYYYYYLLLLFIIMGGIFPIMGVFVILHLANACLNTASFCLILCIWNRSGLQAWQRVLSAISSRGFVSSQSVHFFSSPPAPAVAAAAVAAAAVAVAAAIASVAAAVAAILAIVWMHKKSGGDLPRSEIMEETFQT
jgi:hypothetical protein